MGGSSELVVHYRVGDILGQLSPEAPLEAVVNLFRILFPHLWSSGIF